MQPGPGCLVGVRQDIRLSLGLGRKVPNVILKHMDF